MTIEDESSFCSRCGNNVNSVVLTATEIIGIQQLFRSAGCRTDFDRAELRELNLRPKEEIVTYLPKPISGIFGLNRSNGFLHLNINDKMIYKDPFSTLITNNRLIFIEPQNTINFENIEGYEFHSRLIDGPPQFKLTVSGNVITFKGSLTIRTGTLGSFFSIMGTVSDDPTMKRETEQNIDQALKFVDAFTELLQTLSDKWEK